MSTCVSNQNCMNTCSPFFPYLGSNVVIPSQFGLQFNVDYTTQYIEYGSDFPAPFLVEGLYVTDANGALSLAPTSTDTYYFESVNGSVANVSNGDAVYIKKNVPHGTDLYWYTPGPSAPTVLQSPNTNQSTYYIYNITNTDGQLLASEPFLLFANDMGHTLQGNSLVSGLFISAITDLGCQDEGTPQCVGTEVQCVTAGGGSATRSLFLIIGIMIVLIFILFLFL